MAYYRSQIKIVKKSIREAEKKRAAAKKAADKERAKAALAAKKQKKDVKRGRPATIWGKVRIHQVRLTLKEKEFIKYARKHLLDLDSFMTIVDDVTEIDDQKARKIEAVQSTKSKRRTKDYTIVKKDEKK